MNWEEEDKVNKEDNRKRKIELPITDQNVEATQQHVALPKFDEEERKTKGWSGIME